MRKSCALLASLGVFLASGAAAPLLGAPAERERVPVDNAFSVWTGDGHLVQTGTNSVVIIGTFGGLVFTNSNDEPTDIGTISCPISLELNLGANSQSGNGSCAFTGNDGAQAFGSWTCTGKFPEGCEGKFRVTSGNGRLKDLKAESRFILRGRMAEFVNYPNEQVSAIGIAIWPDLRVLTQTASVD